MSILIRLKKRRSVSPEVQFVLGVCSLAFLSAVLAVIVLAIVGGME